jgi:hypothetical protein
MKRDPNCAVPGAGKFYYFWSTPLTLYVNNGGSLTYEKWLTPLVTGVLSGFNIYEWNRFMFKVVTVGTNSTINIFVNDNITSAEYTSTTNLSMVLSKIAFCFYDSVGLIPGKMSCSYVGQDIQWVSAYYRNIRVWDTNTATEWVAQAYNHSVNNQ